MQDVHWMLATVISEPTDTGPRRQLQVPIAHVLLATVAGVSTQLLHAPGKGTGGQFKECISRFFPWDLDPPTGVSNHEAAKILYEVFRNPLVHHLGLDRASAPAVRIGQVFRGTVDAESRVEELERLTAKPYSEPCLVVTPERRVLWLDPFYSGVRKPVERWSRMRMSLTQGEIRDNRNAGAPMFARLGGWSYARLTPTQLRSLSERSRTAIRLITSSRST